MATRVNGVDNVPHLVGSGTNKIILVLPDTYSEVGASLGVVKLVGDAPDGVTSTTVGNAIKNGICRKIKISYIGANAKRKTSELIVSSDKATQAIGVLTGKTYRGFKIKTAYYPTHIRLG